MDLELIKPHGALFTDSFRGDYRIVTYDNVGAGDTNPNLYIHSFLDSMLFLCGLFMAGRSGALLIPFVIGRGIHDLWRIGRMDRRKRLTRRLVMRSFFLVVCFFLIVF